MVNAYWPGKAFGIAEAIIGAAAVGLAEARKDAQVARPQAKGGLDCQGRRLAAAQVQFPDLVVAVIGWAEADIGGQHQ